MLIFAVSVSKHVNLGMNFVETHHIPKFPVTDVKHNLVDSPSYCQALTALVFPSFSDIDGQQNNGCVPTSLTASNMRTALLWIMTLDVVVVSYRRFGTNYRFHPQRSRNLEPRRWDRQVVPKRR